MNIADISEIRRDVKRVTSNGDALEATIRRLEEFAESPDFRIFLRAEDPDAVRSVLGISETAKAYVHASFQGGPLAVRILARKERRRSRELERRMLRLKRIYLAELDQIQEEQ